MRAYVAGFLVMISGLGVLRVAHAAPPADADFLEFLGSVDSDDKNWHEYLANTDINKVARRANAAGRIPPNGPPKTVPANSSTPAATAPASNAPPANSPIGHS